MKKVWTVILCLIAGLCLWANAYNVGIHHAIYDSCIWTVDRYDPENPDASAWGEYDQVIYIELDDNLYTHGMYQG